MQEKKELKTMKLFFNQMIDAYKNKNPKNMISKFTDLVKKGYQLTAQNWKVSYNFNSAQGVDTNYINILELIKQWQISRVTSIEGEFNGFKIYMNIFDIVLKYLDSITQSNSWIIPFLKCIISKSKIVLTQAKAAGEKINKSTDKLRQNIFQQLRSIKISRNMEERLKNDIMLLIDNLQVSIYFSIHDYVNSERTLSTLKRRVGQHSVYELDNFYFQSAKVSLINNKIKQAQQYFQKINIKNPSQLKLILRYLIPCKIFLGKMTTNPDFPEYLHLTQSIIKGDFRTFELYMKKFQKLWIKRGIYLLMEKMRILVWRNLIKRISKVLGKDGQKIEMDYIVKGVHIMGGEQNINQCMCIISNLIYQGYIKGYIFHNENKKTLVLKKSGAFPNFEKVIGTQ